MTPTEIVRKHYPEAEIIGIAETFAPAVGQGDLKWVEVAPELPLTEQTLWNLQSWGVTAVAVKLIDRHEDERTADFQLREFGIPARVV
jgi:hypothetical protein